MHLNESKMMNCGYIATIIKYNSYNNIDVQFEDGTIVNKRKYDEFKAGKIRPTNLYSLKHLNEEIILRDGRKCKIIEAKNFNDVSIQFEDKTCLYHITYRSLRQNNFLYGRHKSHKSASHLGETYLTNCKIYVTIIRENGSNDIDVQFEDGAIVKHTTYSNLLKGNVAHPKTKAKNKYLGLTKMMNCGTKATVIRVYNAKDLTIRFETGEIREHIAGTTFLKGEVKKNKSNCNS